MPFDFSGLVGKTFRNTYDDLPIVVYAAYFYEGEVKVVVSTGGACLHETNLSNLKPCPEEETDGEA